MPQISLHHDGLHVQMQIPENAPTEDASTEDASTDVFEWADRLVELARRLTEEAVTAQLADRLRRELGPRGASNNRFERSAKATGEKPAGEEPAGEEPAGETSTQGDVPACPACGSGAAYRKGTRSRTVEVPRLGAVCVDRPYLECRDCGRSYAPYAAGIPGRKRYPTKALRRPIEATLESSYRRGAAAYPESPSARTLWRAIQAGPADAQEAPDAGHAGAWPLSADRVPSQKRTCVADATRIPGREAGQQHSLSVAHAVRPAETPGPGGRPALDRRPVAARVGSETRVREALRSVPINTLITDGKMDMSGVASHLGRCRWHLPRSVRYLLYKDGVKGAANEELTDTIRSLVYASYPSPEAFRAALTEWANMCHRQAPHAATAVERAIDGLVVYAEAPGAFTVETTAPIEREMRELNRRFENGGQWTRSGAEHLLQWHQIYRHHPDRWDEWFSRPAPT